MSGEKEPALKLERVLGLSSLSNSSFCSSSTGDLFYSAGSAVVRYSPIENKQKGFYVASKAVSCIAVSPNGRYLAVGERGHNPLISIWDISRMEKRANLSGHKFGVGCLKFSPDNRYLVSAGFKRDRQLILWEWQTDRKLSIQKLGNKVNAIDWQPCGEYFVTAGDRHLKWWTVLEVLDGEAVSLEGKPASIIEDLKTSNFMDIICGDNDLLDFTYCTTVTGVLCVFNNETRMVDKWVQLETPSSFCMELFCDTGTPGLLTIGCANGTIRCFAPQKLEYVATLPLPAPLAAYSPSAGTVGTIGTEGPYYAACLGLKKVAGSKMQPVPKLSAIYGDNSLFVWDISDIYSISRYRSFQFHRGCVWDIQFLPLADGVEVAGEEESSSSGRGASISSPAVLTGVNSGIPGGSFVTCSSDNTIRVWNLDSRAQKQSKLRTTFSREMLHQIDLSTADDTAEAERRRKAADVTVSESQVSLDMTAVTKSISGIESMLDGQEADIVINSPNSELPTRPQSLFPPRAMAVHPSGTHLACGDKKGRVRIFDISCSGRSASSSGDSSSRSSSSKPTVRMISEAQLHSAEILTLHYSPPLSTLDAGQHWTVVPGHMEDEEDAEGDDKPMVMLASAGRDRLIHVLNSSMDYSPIGTLDSHSSSVTMARFTSDGQRLLSCGGDKTMVFHSVNGPEITRSRSVQTPNGSINGLAIDASNKFAVTSGTDKRLNVWNVEKAKLMRAYKNEYITSELYKSDIDPSGMFIATCAFDKTISVFDFFSGDTIAQVSGHSELITGVRFSLDGRHLISIGGDGCIMVWKLGAGLVKAMQDRLLELVSSAQKRNNKAILASSMRSATTAAAAAAATTTTTSNTAALTSLPKPPPRTTSMDKGKGVSGPVVSARPLTAPPQPPPITIVAAAAPAPVGSAWAARVNKDDFNKMLPRHSFAAGDGSSSTSPSRVKHNNKFTLELTSAAFDQTGDVGRDDVGAVISASSVAPPKSTVGKPTAVATGSGGIVSGSSGNGRSGVASPNPMAESLEEQDEVLLRDGDDDDDDEEEEDDDDGSKLFKGVTPQPGADDEDLFHPDFESTPEDDSCYLNSSDTSTDDLGETISKLNVLERSAEHLENWLETMLRDETKLEAGAAAAAASLPTTREEASNVTSSSKAAGEKLGGSSHSREVTDEGESGHPQQLLNQSLSSAFFKNLKNKEEVDSSSASRAGTVQDDVLLPPPPPPAMDGEDSIAIMRKAGLPSGAASKAVPVAAVASTSADRQMALEKKKREAAASLAVMKERLRAMGILDRTGSTKPCVVGAKDNEEEEEKHKSNSFKAVARQDGRDDDDDEEEEEEDRSEDLQQQEQQLKNIKNRIGARIGANKQPSPAVAPPACEEEVFMPPLPPPTVSNNDDIRPGTPETVSEDGEGDDGDDADAQADIRNGADDAEEEDELHSSGTTIQPETQQPLLKPEQVAKMLREKTDSYMHVLTELESAKKAAEASYAELMNLRRSLEYTTSHHLNTPVAPSSSGSLSPERRQNQQKSASTVNDSIDVDQSMADTEKLLSRFRQSFSSLSLAHSQGFSFPGTGAATASGERRRGGGGGRAATAVGSDSMMGDTHNTTTITGLTGNENSLEVSQILDMYSDRLADMVSQKILKKMPVVPESDTST